MATDERDALISRLTEVLLADDRVRAAWLSGSVGRGTADRFSDVDVVAAVSSHDLEAFVADWPKQLPQVASTVLTQKLGGGATQIFSHVTPEWLRFDLVVTTVYQVADRSGSTLRLLFDHDDIHRLLRGRVEWEPSTPARVGELITEFFNVLGLLPVVLGRNELFVAASGAARLRDLVMRLMLADATKTEAGGLLHLSKQLSTEAMAQLNELPPIVAEREAVLRAHSACAEVFLPLARRLAERVGAVWPEGLAVACAGYLRRELGIEVG
jgi:hypothetical protein